MVVFWFITSCIESVFQRFGGTFFSPSSGCLADVVAEVIGRKECVIYIGKFEKLLANRRWNGACTEIMGITSTST